MYSVCITRHPHATVCVMHGVLWLLKQNHLHSHVAGQQSHDHQLLGQQSLSWSANSEFPTLWQIDQIWPAAEVRPYALQINVVCRVSKTELYLIPDCTTDESLSMHGQSVVQHSSHKLGVSCLHSISSPEVDSHTTDLRPDDNGNNMVQTGATRTMYITKRMLRQGTHLIQYISPNNNLKLVFHGNMWCQGCIWPCLI